MDNRTWSVRVMSHYSHLFVGFAEPARITGGRGGFSLRGWCPCLIIDGRPAGSSVVIGGSTMTSFLLVPFFGPFILPDVLHYCGGLGFRTPLWARWRAMRDCI
ncbi:hypothetical protein BDV59DRAFT_5182 [Aspergillus ambiguus]|uniref:uncharacterized protein n=1 Tax=Aspergillus ambiguus TaxID=176160 RepID=UPI003CCDB19E